MRRTSIRTDDLAVTSPQGGLAALRAHFRAWPAGLAVLAFAAGYLAGTVASSGRTDRDNSRRAGTQGQTWPSEDGEPAIDPGPKAAENNSTAGTAPMSESSWGHASTADFVRWYGANQRDLSLPVAEDAVLEDFAEEIVVPIGEIPPREKLVRLLDVYCEFHRGREGVRTRRRQLRASMPDAPLDEPPLDGTFEEEYALMRGLLDGLVFQLSEKEYWALVGSEHWKPLCKVIGRDK